MLVLFNLTNSYMCQQLQIHIWAFQEKCVAVVFMWLCNGQMTNEVDDKYKMDGHWLMNHCHAQSVCSQHERHATKT